MEDLDNKWILHSGGADCSDSDDNSPATLGLDNMRGVFILVGAGIVATFFGSKHYLGFCAKFNAAAVTVAFQTTKEQTKYENYCRLRPFSCVV